MAAARPPTDVFRPCLPFDPFAGVEPGPWRPSISPHADPPAALLVLGDPEPADLLPLLFSQSLANSLVVIATHAPPLIPRTPLPAVRILRLSAPLAHDAGALRLVGLIERADRVVRRFRADWTESQRKLVQLATNSITGEFEVEEAYSPAEPSRTRSPGEDLVPRYPSPAPSATSSFSSSASSVRTSSSTFSTTSSSISRRRRAQLPTFRPPPTDRAFDAIINFLPSSLPDKFLLKHAILVSTLSASFITAPPAPSKASVNSRQQPSDAHLPDSAKDRKSRRFSTLLRRSPVSDPARHLRSASDIHIHEGKGKSRSQSHLTPSHPKPHLVHVLPPHVYHHQTTGASDGPKKPSKVKPKPKLVQSIEQFLLAFGYPLQSISLLPSSASNSSLGSNRISMASTMSSSFLSASFSPGFATGATTEKPIPFLLPAGVLGSTPSGGRLSIGEILLMGGFDNSGRINPENGAEGEGIAGMAMEEGRVWIGSPHDVVWDVDLGTLATNPTPCPPTVSPPNGHLHAPSPTHPRFHPSRSSSLPTPGSLELTSLPSSTTSPAALKPPPPSAQLTPPKPALTKSFSSPSSESPLSPPAPTHNPNGKSTKPNVLSKSKSRRLSTSSSLFAPSPSETIVSQELKQRQLPTPPGSASSLEDGNDDDDDRMTSETTIVETGSLPSVVVSTTDGHHHHRILPSRNQHQQQQGKAPYVKAASTLGHGHSHSPVSGGTGGMNLKGLFARFGFGLGKLRVLKVGERVGRAS